MNERLITTEGLARLTEELDRLRTTGRREAAERLRHAVAAEADPSTNADYIAAREEQARLEGRIAQLEERLAAARVVGPDHANDTVDVGERVRLRDLDTGARFVYELVGSFEADPAAGRISAESPVGRALIGRRPGEVAHVQAPKGEVRLRVVGIEAA
jgi:transcription elongation factor GreA